MDANWCLVHKVENCTADHSTPQGKLFNPDTPIDMDQIREQEAKQRKKYSDAHKRKK